MGVRHHLNECPYQVALLVGVRVERRLDAVGHQRLQTAELPPTLKFRGVAKHLQEIRLMVALEEHRLAVKTSLNEKIEGLSGIGSAVDVVTQKNLDRSAHRISRHVGVNYGEHLL